MDPQPAKPSGRIRFGVALGGGGSRAFLHLGVLSRLIEAGLAPGCLSGSSMGAVLGAMYASDRDPAAAIPRILDYFRKSSLFGAFIRPAKGDGLHRRPGFGGIMAKKLATASVAATISFCRGLRKTHPVNKAIDALFPGEGPDIGQLAIPFGLNALDLTSGTVRDFVSGPLNPALKAGVAVGLVFRPWRWNGADYADAAPLCPVPVGLCRKLGARTVLAVDICAPLERGMRMDSGFDVVRRIMAVQSDELNRLETASADLVLGVDVSDIFWADFSRIDEAYERGREAASGILDPLREKLAEAEGDGV